MKNLYFFSKKRLRSIKKIFPAIGFVLSFLLVLTISLTSVSAVYSQTNDAQEPTKSTEPSSLLENAPVVIDGDELLVIQDKVGTLTPQERAQQISETLLELADNRQLDTRDIFIKDKDAQTDLIWKNQVIMSIFNVDAQSMNLSRVELARQYQTVIISGINAYREARTPKNIAIAVGKAILATLVFLVIFKLLQKLNNVVRFFDTQHPLWQPFTHVFRTLDLETDFSEQLFTFALRIVNLGQFLLLVTLFLLYITTVLSFFPWTRALSNNFFSSIFAALAKIGQGVIDYIPNLLFLIVLGFLTYYTLRLTQFFFKKVSQGTITLPGFYQDWAEPTSGLIQFLLLVLALIVAFPYLPGSGSGAFQGVSIFLGILFSLGSSSALSNVVAGVFLTYVRNFQIGDYVEIAGVKGTVISKGMLVTRLCTNDNYFVSIPNGQILNSSITSFRNGIRPLDENIAPPILGVEVTVSYDVPQNQVYQMLLTIASDTEYVLEEPASYVEHVAYNNFYATYKLSVYTHDSDKEDEIRSKIRRRFQDLCIQEGIDLVSPYYLTSRDKSFSKILDDNRASSNSKIK